MRFTTTKMAEQYVQNMYNKPAKETTNTKNDKFKDNKNVPAQKEDNAAVYEGSVIEQPKATYSKPMAVSQKKEDNTRCTYTDHHGAA